MIEEKKENKYENIYGMGVNGMPWTEFNNAMQGKLNRKEDLNRNEIEYLLENNNIENYTINEDLTVDVNGDVDLSNRYLAGGNRTHLPFKFGKVTGNFNISNNSISSLKNCPDEIGGDFDASENNLKSLDYATPYVKGKFDIWSNYNEFENSIENDFTDIFGGSDERIKNYARSKYLENRLQENIPNKNEINIESLHAQVQANKHNVEIPKNLIKESNPEVKHDIGNVQTQELKNEHTQTPSFTRNRKLKI